MGDSPEQRTPEAGASAHAADVLIARRALDGGAVERAALGRRLQCVPKVMAALNRRLGSPLTAVDVEDAAQDAVAAIWRRLPSYAGRSALESWAYRFCQNVLSERIRVARRRPLAVEYRGDHEAPAADEETPAAEDFGHVFRALEEIRPPEDAELVRMKHFGAMTFAEIGERVGLSPNTVKTRYYRALERLREALGPLRREGVL